MLYCLIIVSVAILIASVISIVQRDEFTLVISLLASFFFTIVYAIGVVACCDSPWHVISVKYDDNRLVEVEESNHILKYRERRNAFTLQDNIQEYELVYKSEVVVSSTKDFTKIERYFKPVEPRNKFERKFGE